MNATPLLAILVSTSVAVAQPAVTPPSSAVPASAGALAERATPPPPGFVMLDGFDASSRAGIDGTYINPNTGGSDEGITLLRFSLHAHYVDAASGLGGYAQLPFSYGSGSGDTITDVGDLELGAIYVPRFPDPRFGLVLHAGITAPTGEKGNAAALGLIESFIATPQLYNSLPEGITGKIGVSPTFRSGNVFARIDLSVDKNFDAADVSPTAGIHYNLGIGVDLGTVAIMAESANLSILSESGRDNGGTLSSIALSTRANGGAVSPYLAVVVPIESDTSDVIDFAVTLGADFRL